MGKLKVVLVAAAVVATVALVVLFWLQGSIRRVVEETSSASMGVATVVQSADLDFLAGTLELSNVEVANPEGFPSSHFLKIAKVRTEFELSSFFGSTLRIPLMAIDDVEINLDSDRGEFNYRRILEHLRKEASGQATEPSSGKKLLISELRVRNITAKLTFAAGTAPVLTPEPFQIPELTLQNLDSDGKNPVALRQLVRTIVETVMKGVAEKGKGQITRELLSSLWGRLTGQSSEADAKTRPEVEGVVNDLQKLLKQP